MSFLYPSFLFALAAVAIPIIIHLFNFRRYKTVYFSNVRFLKEVKEQTDSRSRLKHLLILLCRILAITFLVIAFAQPYIKRKSTPVAAGKRAISVFIDNSFSMGQLAGDVPLLDLAKSKAGEIVRAYGADDLFQLLTQDFEGKQQRLVDRDEAINLIKEVGLSTHSHLLSDIIARQRQALSNSGASQRSIFVISDFQKNFNDFSLIKADTSYGTSLVPLHAREAENVFIDTCSMEAPVQITGQVNRMIVKIRNESNQPLENGRLTLKINNETKAIGNFSIAAQSSTDDTLSYTVTEKGWGRAELSLADHPITFDDSYFLVYPVIDHRLTLVVNETTESPYLNALLGKNDFFVMQNVAFNQLNYADLLKQQFVILNGLKQISTGLSSELKKFVEGGGNLLVFPDAGADISSYNSFFQMMGADQFSGFSTQKKTVSEINTRNEVFADVFQQVPQNLALPQVSGSFINVTRTNTTAELLLSFSDRSSFISKYAVGSGLFFVSSVPLDKNFTDLPLNPLFAPMLYRMAIVKESAPLNAMVIGRNNLVTVPADVALGAQVLRLKGMDQEFIPAQRLITNQVTVNINNEINLAGIYSLEDEAKDVKNYVAMNYDRRESDMQLISNDDLLQQSKSINMKVIQNAGRDLSNVISGQHLGLSLWKVSAIFVLLFLTLETVLLKFWK
ncbi:MAG: BatA domain-containing protein [Chitinophagales bacterium]|nr:BatA domain-containing protein [Chitinophagales bacterium]